MIDASIRVTHRGRGNVAGLALCSHLSPMDSPQNPSAYPPVSDGRSVPGKVFVVVFVAVAVIIAAIGTSMRLDVRPKYQAAVASSSAKAMEIEAKAAAAAASAKPPEESPK